MSEDPLLLDDDVKPTDLRTRYPLFYGNRTIASLADQKRWSVTDPETKMPVSMRGLVTYNRIWGASTKKSSDMWTLRSLAARMPRAANCALALQGQEMGYAIVDIESDCPDDVRENLMTLPWEYAERSLSGKGIHLLIPYPEKLVEQFPNAQKAALKDKSKTWEVLLDHWVTFTRDALDPNDYPDRGTNDTETVLKELFAEQKPKLTSGGVLKDMLKDEDVPGFKQIFEAVLQDCNAHFRYDLKSKNGDKSSADMRLACQIARAARNELKEIDAATVPNVHHVTARVFVQHAKDAGLWRDKYEEPRGDDTWLGLTISNAVGLIMADVIQKESEEQSSVV